MSVIDAIIAKKLCGGGGGGSIPKPLTYDYMPEGYPSKTMETVTLMEAQELAFSLMGNELYIAPLTDAFEIVEDQTYTVNWDGTEYDCVCRRYSDGDSLLGNKSFTGAGDDTGEPFLYISSERAFATLDTSASHIISVKGREETVTPMAEEYIPKPLTYDHMPEGYPSKSRFTIEWDGNTKGLTAQGSWYKVSDLVVDPSVFASGATLTYAGGRTDFMSTDAATGKNLITIEPGKVTFGEGQVLIFTETPEPPYEAFEIGVYFESDEYYDVRKVTGGEVITPMAEEFIPNIPADKLPAGSGGVTTLHINVTAVNRETMNATFTADKTPEEMQQASVNGPTWCVVTFAAGVMAAEAVSIGVPPAWIGGAAAFGEVVAKVHGDDGNNTFIYVVRAATRDRWSLDVTQFGG